jgi:hypothetical protein
MLDILPFLRLTTRTPEEQIGEIADYLMQIKEALEFALGNISTENLSPDLVNKLNSLGAEIESSKNSREEELVQVSNKTITVSDVCGSSVFKSAVNGQVADITFSVNFSTGNLDFTLPEPEVPQGG